MKFNLNKFKEIALTIDSIGLLYISVVGGLCHVLPIPEIVKAFLALPSLLIIPYLIGKTLSLLLEKFQYIEFNFDIVSNFVINWCIGLIFIVSTAYFLNYFWLFDAKMFVLFLIILMIPGTFYKYKEEQENVSDFINNYGGKVPIILSILIGVVMVLFITHFSPYPYVNAIDFIFHNYWSLQLIDYNFFFFGKAYLITLSILNSIPTLIFNLGIDSLKLWWSSRFIFYPLYSFGLYIFSYEISKNKGLSLITVFIGTFITYHGEGFMFLYHTAPKIIIFLLFPLLLFIVHKIIIKKLRVTETENRRFIILFTLIGSLFIIEFIIFYFNKEIADFIGVVFFLFLIIILIIGKYLKSNERLIFFLIMCMITVLLFFHTGNGFFASFFILLYLFISFFIKKQSTLSRFLIYSVVIFTLLLFILQMKEIVEFEESLIDVYDTSTPFGFEKLWEMINNIYHPTILLLFFTGAVFALFYNKNNYISLIFLVSIMFIIFLSPIKDMYRLLIYLNPLIAFFCAYSLIKCYNILFLKNIQNIKPILVSLIIVISILLPVVNCMDEIKKVTSKEDREGYFTKLSPSQFRASEYIKFNIPRDTMVLTNGQRAIYYASYSKTRYPYNILYQKNNSKNAELYLDIFLTENAKEAYKKIDILINNKSFTCYDYDFRPNRCKQQPVDNLNAIVIVDWVTKNWIRKYTNKSIVDIMNKFYNTTYFTLLYEEKKNGICVFGVNPEPGVPFELVNN